MKAADWKEVHGELTRLARMKGAYDAEEARWLLEGKRVRVHEPLAFATYLEYLERILGYGPRLATERLRVAEALVRLPALRDALAANALSWSAVRELSRAAVPSTEAEWITAATGKTVRQVEEMVSGRRAGRSQKPSDREPPVWRTCSARRSSFSRGRPMRRACPTLLAAAKAAGRSRRLADMRR